MKAGTKKLTEGTTVMNNKITGNRFEADLCETLRDYGFWAHNMAQNAHGQPADVIAVKYDIAYLIDCKDCENDTFPLSRIEPNQEAAMTMWDLCHNQFCYFALRLTNGVVYMLHFDKLMLLEDMGKKTLSKKEIMTFPSFLEWVGDM